MSDVFVNLSSLMGTFLSDDEESAAQIMLNNLNRVGERNRIKGNYYEGKQFVRDMGIAIPPQLRDMDTIVGWPGTIVDTYDERIDLKDIAWKGTGADPGVAEIVKNNKLTKRANWGHLDSLIYGISFGVTGAGDTTSGEPEVLVTYESPMTMTVLYDFRTFEIQAGLSRYWDMETHTVAGFTLYFPDETLDVERNMSIGRTSITKWKVTNRDQHYLGRVLIRPLTNRRRTADPYGRSEITSAVRYYTDNAVRTLLGQEVAREFFSTPQRYLLGVGEEAFTRADGSLQNKWDALMSKIVALEGSQDDTGKANPITAGQWDANPPTAQIAILNMLAQLMSAETGLPGPYFGIETVNPASADAINAGEARIIKRSERRIETGEEFHEGLMDDALLVLDPSHPVPAGSISVQYGDPATPTKAATGDWVTKLVGAGVLPPTSKVTRGLMGLSPDQITELETEDAANEAKAAKQAQDQAVATAQALAQSSLSRPADGATATNPSPAAPAALGTGANNPA